LDGSASLADAARLRKVLGDLLPLVMLLVENCGDRVDATDDPRIAAAREALAAQPAEAIAKAEPIILPPLEDAVKLVLYRHFSTEKAHSVADEIYAEWAKDLPPEADQSPSSPACRDCQESPPSQYGRLCDTHFMEAERKAMRPQDAPSREGV
jgi:hypothetical protein